MILCKEIYMIIKANFMLLSEKINLNHFKYLLIPNCIMIHCGKT